jgi:arylsulfatase A-like enzyme
MKCISFFVLVLCLICISCTQTKEQEVRKPNILFLLADDLGYGELGSYGQKVIKTPVLDSLASSGMRFTDFYAGSSVCSPSRAVLMTGKHTGHSTIRGNNGIFENDLWDRVPLNKDEFTLGEMMKTAGYQTAFVGKWHLDDPNDVSTWAVNRGFDYAIQEQWPARIGGKQFDGLVHWINNDKDSIRYEQEKYDCIDEFRTDFILEYLDQKEENKPFFIFMSYRIPHAHERYTRNKELYADRGWNETERRHAARITLLDKQIGRLLEKLEKVGELDHTLILFTSDNGPHSEGSHDHLFFNSAGGLRGYKRDLYEGGIRVPFFAVWKDKIEPGTTSKRQAAFHDFMPTFAQVAGIDTPEQSDGISLLPELLGEESKGHEYLYWEIQLVGWGRQLPKGGFRQAIRSGKWKAVRYGIESDTELFDLEDDPTETTDLSEQYPAVVEKANRLFIEARIETPNFPYGGKIQNYRARDRYNPARAPNP